MNEPSESMTNQPEPAAKTPSNTELALQRTEMAETRTELAERRTGMSEKRTGMAEQRTDLAEERTELAQVRNQLAEVRTELARERTRAAEERTLMAWVRTSLSMISFGFGIDRFFKYLTKTDGGNGVDALTEERILGLSLMSLGIFALIAAIIGHWRILKNIEARDYKYTPGWSQGLTVAVVLLFVGLAAFIPLFVTGMDMSQIFTLNSKVVQNLGALTVFIIMLTMGVQTPLSDLTVLWQRPTLLAKALLAALVFFPLGAAAIGYALSREAPIVIGIGLVLVAAAPGAPLLTRRATMAGGNVAIASSLQITLAVLAILSTPLTLMLFTALFARVEASIPFLIVAKQILTVQLLPLGLGLLLQKLSGDAGKEIADLLATIANTLFLVVLVFLLGISYYLVPTVDPRGLIAIPLIALFGLACGHLLGGPELDVRSSVATATIARNAGLALFLAAANGVGQAIPTIVAYVILGAVFALPYNVWIKRQMQLTAAPQR
jgi:predicted Na+-dependent transporter